MSAFWRLLQASPPPPLCGRKGCEPHAGTYRYAHKAARRRTSDCYSAVGYSPTLIMPEHSGPVGEVPLPWRGGTLRWLLSGEISPLAKGWMLIEEYGFGRFEYGTVSGRFAIGGVWLTVDTWFLHSGRESRCAPARCCGAYVDSSDKVI